MNILQGMEFIKIPTPRVMEIISKRFPNLTKDQAMDLTSQIVNITISSLQTALNSNE